MPTTLILFPLSHNSFLSFIAWRLFHGTSCLCRNDKYMFRLIGQQLCVHALESIREYRLWFRQSILDDHNTAVVEMFSVLPLICSFPRLFSLCASCNWYHRHLNFPQLFLALSHDPDIWASFRFPLFWLCSSGTVKSSKCQLPFL